MSGGNSVRKLVTTVAEDVAWGDWEGSTVVLDISPSSRTGSMQLAEVDKCMSRWQRATLGMLNMRYSDRATSAVCLSMGTAWGLHGKKESKVLLTFS